MRWPSLVRTAMYKCVMDLWIQTWSWLQKYMKHAGLVGDTCNPETWTHVSHRRKMFGLFGVVLRRDFSVFKILISYPPTYMRLGSARYISLWGSSHAEWDLNIRFSAPNHRTQTQLIYLAIRGHRDASLLRRRQRCIFIARKAFTDGVVYSFTESFLTITFNTFYIFLMPRSDWCSTAL